jgi:hypothetical protein
VTTHAEAHRLAAAGFQATFARLATPNEVLHLQGVGLLETSYGDGWSEPQAVGSNNIGAVIAGESWRGETFEHRDSEPIDGSDKSRWYVTRFRKYPTPEAGWADLARIMYRVRNRSSVLLEAGQGDTYGVSAALYATAYYRGFGSTADIRIKRHFAKLSKCVASICRALELPLPNGVVVPPPTLKRGSRGPEVADLQRFLGGLVVDGRFGDATHTRVIEFQRLHGLKPDGKVGEMTWAKIDALDPA